MAPADIRTTDAPPVERPYPQRQEDRVAAVPSIGRATRIERKAARHLDLEPERPLVQIRQIVPPDRGAEHADRNKRNAGRSVRKDWPVEQHT